MIDNNGLTWGMLKKAVDLELEDDAKVKEIQVTEMYYRGVTIHYDRSRNAYVIVNKND